MSSSGDLVVAIDGPSASGKSTVSKLVAKDLGFTYVDSGSLYRGITWKALQEHVDCKDSDAILSMIAGMDLEFFEENQVVGFRIDGVNPGQSIRADSVVERVSDIAAMPEVREFINEKLRSMVVFEQIVVEGRDIGSVVFPESRFKFYLDADPEERARRRHQETAKEKDPDELRKVLDALQRRDHKDTTRETAPLQVPEGANVVNTTTLGIDDVVAMIVRQIRDVGVAP